MHGYHTGAARAFIRAAVGEFARLALVVHDALSTGRLTEGELMKLDMDWLLLRSRLELFVRGSNPNDDAKARLNSGIVARRFVALADQLKAMADE